MKKARLLWFGLACVVLWLAKPAIVSGYYFFSENIPYRVAINYNYSGAYYKEIRKCFIANSTLYLVDFGGGYMGTTNYFDSEGKKIGQYHYSDDASSNKSPPIDISSYHCDDLHRQQ